MPRATTKLPLLFDTTNEMVQKTSVPLSEGHLHDFAQGLFGTEELGGGKYCATATHCSEGFVRKTLNNCRGMIVFATLRQPLTRSNSRKQRSRGRVASQTKTCGPFVHWKLPWRHRRVHMHVSRKWENFSRRFRHKTRPIYYNALFGIYSGIRSGIYFGILSDILSGICSGPCVPGRVGSSP